MKCPIDGSTLVITHREGIEIDYCPQCRGVWLDRGELDKIIDRSMTEPASVTDVDDRSGKEHNHRSGKRKKKSGFLSEVFDIFD